MREVALYVVSGLIAIAVGIVFGTGIGLIAANLVVMLGR
jgi:hypothetical protein